MKNYIGCKIIKAEPKTYGEYRLEKYGNTNYESNIKDDAAGYMVIYPAIGDSEEPYISWSPKDVFEKAYRIIEDAELNFIINLYNQ